MPDFEGTLRDLLQQVERGEVDVVSISLTEIARQHAVFWEASPETDADALADYISSGSRLLSLKAGGVLNWGPEPRIEVEEENSESDEELRPLFEGLQQFKGVTQFLAEMEKRGRHAYPRLAPLPDSAPTPGLQGVTLKSLMSLAREALSRHPPSPEGVIAPEPITVRRKVEEITAVIARAGRISFRQVMLSCTSRIEVVVAFLAMLELLGSGRIEAVQGEPFGDIILQACSSPPVNGDGSPP